MKITLKFVPEKETPGTIRYKEVTALGKRPVVRTLYLTKESFGSESPPDELTVTIESS